MSEHYTNIYVSLSKEEFISLSKLAQRDRRHPKEKIKHMLFDTPSDKKPEINEPIKLGVIEFHTFKNKALIDDFYRVVADLRDASCIVDLWLMDIAATLDKHGYTMKVWRKESK